MSRRWRRGWKESKRRIGSRAKKKSEGGKIRSLSMENKIVEVDVGLRSNCHGINV